MHARTKEERDAVARRGGYSAQILSVWLLGNEVVKSEDELDEHFEAVIDLLDEARNERWRLRKR